VKCSFDQNERTACWQSQRAKCPEIPWRLRTHLGLSVPPTGHDHRLGQERKSGKVYLQELSKRTDSTFGLNCSNRKGPVFDPSCGTTAMTLSVAEVIVWIPWDNRSSRMIDDGANGFIHESATSAPFQEWLIPMMAWKVPLWWKRETCARGR